jgi:Zn-dependent protease with chaperone function
MPIMSPSASLCTTRFPAVATALAAAALMLAASSEAQNAKPATVDAAMMNRAGEIAFARELDRARAKRALDTNAGQLTSARRMSTLLIAYASTMAPEASSWIWEVHLETREEPVAYCFPGGKIMLSTGLVDRAKLTPPELAVVLAHVIAHALAGDDAATAAAQLATMRESPDPNRRIVQLADLLGKIMLSEPHEKETERETDAITLEFMARAGVDPEPAAEAWRKIARQGGAKVPGFLALHPTWPGRIEAIEAQIPPILPLYEQARAEQAARPRLPPVRARPGLN